MQQHKPVRIAVVGCGAVTQSFHLPVLAGHEGVSISALIDPDVKRAERLAALYHVPLALPSIDRLDRTVADAALIATPAFLHAPGSIELMNRGLHVLVEKPMALTLADGERMVTAARDRGVILTVGLFRRLLPAIRLFRAALDAGDIGDVLNVSAEVGDSYTWHLTTLAGMRRQEAGGGMLVDMGSHVLDLLLYICDATPSLVQYSDNAGAGIETDCAIELGLSRRGSFVPAHVELSRTRTLGNSIRVEGSRGTIEWKFGERARVLIHAPSTHVDTLTASVRECAIEARWRDEPEQQGFEGFRAQIDDFVGAINGDHPPHLSGASVLPSVELIEQCYAQRVPMSEPWFTEGLTKSVGTVSHAADSHRVLVTGASGFIGCRLSERLHFASDWRVKAMIRTPGRAVRLARMPIDFAIGDLASASDLTKALEGCEAVVHAGIGTSWRRSERISTNVNGTRNLVDAALRAGVKRFVHISTIALYGERVDGVITEDTPPHPKKGWDYAESKLAAERIVLEAAAKGLPAVVLRVAVVYGPHNMTVTARPLQHLAKQRLFLADCDDVPSNTIYIDNLCHGIQLALDGGPEINGQTFLLSDDDGYTWGDYFGYFADRMGVAVGHVRKQSAGTSAAPSRPPSLPARWLRSTRDVLMSSEMKALAKRIYLADPWGTPVRWGIDRFPAAAEKAKRLIRPEEGFVYRPSPVTATELPPFTIDPIEARVSTEKAALVLGYQPIVARPRAMELTLAWARHARLVPEPSRDPRSRQAAKRHMPRRVLYLAWAPFFSGAERALLLTLRSLDQRRYAPYVLAGTEGEFAAEVRALGIPCDVAALRPFDGRHPVASTLSIASVLGAAIRHRVSLIHSNEVPSFQPGGHAAKVLRLPSVTHVRFFDHGQGYRWFLRTTPSEALFVSRNLMTHALTETPAIFEGRSEVLYDAVEPQDAWSDTERARVRGQLGLPLDRTIVAIAGQIAEIKGIWDFVDAIALLAARGEEPSFAVLGDDLKNGGNVRRAMEDRIAALGLSSRVTFLGFRKDAPRIVQAFDIIAVPSHEEPLGNATLEAMAAGRPVVGTRVGGIPEMIVEGETGLLVPRSDPEALADAIGSLVRDPRLRAQMSASARRRAHQTFGFDVHAAALQTIYDRLCSRTAAATQPEGRLA